MTTTAGEGTDTTSVNLGYDRLGRQISYTDAHGAVTKTQYDALGRVSKVTGGDGATTTYGYDHANEPRGLATAVTDSVAGTMTGTYDADGSLVTQNLPGGVTMIQTEDTTGSATARTWIKDQADGSTVALLEEEVAQSVHGQWLARDGRVSAQKYAYDRAGRLTVVADTANGICATRAYGFDANSNRTHRKEATAAAGEPCPATPSPGSPDHAYDSADRLVDPGYHYDAFGRTTALPGTSGID